MGEGVGDGLGADDGLGFGDGVGVGAGLNTMCVLVGVAWGVGFFGRDSPVGERRP